MKLECLIDAALSELAHQWFGNLVTMDWWDELWLNEGFATWVGWLAVDHFYPGKYSGLHIYLLTNGL
jgi:aminopeptidase N